MKVKDLVKELKKFDGELEVFKYDHEWGHSRVGSIKVETNIEIHHHFTNKKSEKFKKGIVI